jgi:hypothetical protein
MVKTSRRRAAGDRYYARRKGSVSVKGHVRGVHLLPPAPGQKAREEAHAARVAADIAAGLDDPPGTVRCWGPCGRSLRHSAMLACRGWRSRELADLGIGNVATEVQCPECYAAWGWIKPRAAAG